MRFLLDTNIVSNLIRDPQGRIAERIKIVGEQEICTSIVVAAELRYGAAKKASTRLTAPTLPPTKPMDQYARSLSWPALPSVATTSSSQRRL